jgi:hypothetical protein
MAGYSLGQCRCEYCRDAYARYRAGRRANGKDDPRSPRSRDTDGAGIPVASASAYTFASRSWI